MKSVKKFLNERMNSVDSADGVGGGGKKSSLERLKCPLPLTFFTPLVTWVAVSFPPFLDVSLPPKKPLEYCCQLQSDRTVSWAEYLELFKNR